MGKAVSSKPAKLAAESIQSKDKEASDEEEVNANEEVRNLIKKSLVKELVNIRKYGADYFEYRVFDSRGSSYSYSDYSNYYLSQASLLANPAYLLAMREYFSQEISLYYRGRGLISYLVRAEEADEDNLYIKTMYLLNFGNGLVMYEFLPDKIRYFFSVY